MEAGGLTCEPQDRFEEPFTRCFRQEPSGPPGQSLYFISCFTVILVLPPVPCHLQEDSSPSWSCPLVPSLGSGTVQASCRLILTDKICQENFPTATLDHVQSLPTLFSQPFSCFTESGEFLFHFCFISSLYSQALSISRARNITTASTYRSLNICQGLCHSCLILRQNTL